MLPPWKFFYTLRSLLRLLLSTNTIPSVLPVCSLHVHMKAIAHANNWSLSLAFHIILTWAPVNFTWAQDQVSPGVATPLQRTCHIEKGWLSALKLRTAGRAQAWSSMPSKDGNHIPSVQNLNQHFQISCCNQEPPTGLQEQWKHFFVWGKVKAENYSISTKATPCHGNTP